MPRNIPIAKANLSAQRTLIVGLLRGRKAEARKTTYVAIVRDLCELEEGNLKESGVEGELGLEKRV
jgi:hypothetical protein